jgi:hypothetical protein
VAVALQAAMTTAAGTHSVSTQPVFRCHRRTVCSASLCLLLAQTVRNLELVTVRLIDVRKDDISGEPGSLIGTCW